MEKQQADVEQYWQKKAEELGEAVLLRSISHTYYRGIPDTFGILYASQSCLVYEYSKRGRKSILDNLFSRRSDQELAETIKIPRKEIRKVALVAANVARSWIRRSLSAVDVLERLERLHPQPLLNILAGTVVCVCTAGDYIVIDTPINRQWQASL